MLLAVDKPSFFLIKFGIMKTKLLNRQSILTVLAAIVIQLILGTAYIWSVFQTGIANSIFNGDNAAAGLTFSLLLAFLTVGSIIGGKLAVRFATRPVVFAGGIILSGGFFLASLATQGSGWLLWGGYGVFGGLGMGFTYATTIACVQKWFPNKKGLSTGIIVSALGFGGVVFTPIVEKLIITFGGQGIGETQTFVFLSVVFLVVCTLGSIFLKNPPPDYAPSSISSKVIVSEKKKDFMPKEMLKTLRFYLVVFSYLFACMGGLMMIGFAKPIAVSKGLEDTATIGVLAVSMFNSIGRLIWGMLSDKFGRKNTIIILLSGSAVSSLFVTVVEGYFIYALIAVIGFFYGGLISTYPSLTADVFGAKYMATNYGLVLLGFGAGVIISSQIAGYYKNLAADDVALMFPAFIIAACCAGLGIIMMCILKSKRLK